jgi:hypothetical protein
MSTSGDGGLTWGAPTPTADSVHGLGGQPVVQPDGRVIVPFEALGGQMRAFSSDDGGASWNASVLISGITSHRVAGVRTSPLPSAEISRDGTVYVAWQDNRFEPGGAANDIVLSSSADGTSWSSPVRIPIDPADGTVDHFIPGLAVNRSSAGANTQLALTYYFDRDPSCAGPTCEIQVGFTSSLDNGKTWSAPQVLSDPMQLAWLAPTTQGVMVGDYISTSFVAGQQRVLGAFAIGFEPSSDGLFDEPMFVGLEKVRAGTNPTGKPRCCSRARFPPRTPPSEHQADTRAAELLPPGGSSSTSGSSRPSRRPPHGRHRRTPAHQSHTRARTVV